MSESPYFPVADQIREARSDRERAQLLLRLSDSALLGGHVDIERACAQSGFAAGQSFLVWRIAALCRTRDAHGLLPELMARELDAWRETMSRIAAGVVPMPSQPMPLLFSGHEDFLDGEDRRGG